MYWVSLGTGVVLTLAALVTGAGGLFGFFGQEPVEAVQLSWVCGWAAFFLSTATMPRPVLSNMHDAGNVTVIVISSVAVMFGTLTYAFRVVGTRMVGQPDPWPPIILWTVGGVTIQLAIIGITEWMDKRRKKPR